MNVRILQYLCLTVSVPSPFCHPETLRRSNQALRQRCEEMEGWQRRTREEREFLSCRFQEARALVERLAQENHSLKSMVNGPGSSSSHCCSSSQTEDLQGRPARNGPVDGSQVSLQKSLICHVLHVCFYVASGIADVYFW